MSSLKQIEANRRNALKSTGPTTPEGKRRSRCNGVRHGLTAETVIATVEDAEDYRAFEAAVIADYDVESAVERELVLRLASVLWRLRHATGIETAIFESVTGKVEHGSSRPTLVEAADLSNRNQLHLVATRQSDATAGNELSFDAKKDIADGFLRLAALPTFALDRLSRYEHCSGGKRDKSCLRWRRCGAASNSRAAQPFRSRSGDASPAPCPKSLGDHSRGQCRPLATTAVRRQNGTLGGCGVTALCCATWPRWRNRRRSTNIMRHPIKAGFVVLTF
jgi:hypothetical protein